MTDRSGPPPIGDRNCPIIERTADGVSVGRCWFYTGDRGACPRHGDVREALQRYCETGKLTPEVLPWEDSDG